MGYQLPDFTAIEPSKGGFDLFQPGIYHLKVAEIGEERSPPEFEGQKASVLFKFEAVDGDRQGDRIHVYFTTKHTNPEYEYREMQKMSALAHAVEVYGGDSDLMLEKTFWAKVKIKPGTNGYKDTNVIDRYYLPGEEVPNVQPAATPTPAPAPAPAPTRPVPVARPAAVAGARPWPKRA